MLAGWNSVTYLKQCLHYQPIKRRSGGPLKRLLGGHNWEAETGMA